MGDVLKGIGMAVAFVGLALVTGGASIGFSAAFDAAFVAGSISVAGITFTGALGTALFGMAAASVLSGIATQFLKPSIPPTQISRLSGSFQTITARKSVFGTTALNLDIRYQEASGPDQEIIDYIVAVAAHKIKSIDEIWFEEKLAWTSSGGVTSTYDGYLFVDYILEGDSSHYISLSSKWNSNCRLTGCAYIHLRIKRNGLTDTVSSPLVNGLPGRITAIGEGAYLYDPRKDSTVSGGSGTHRADDQSTWGSYTDPDDCDNPVLQLLWWLLGWKINDILSVGCGVPHTRIDMESFITAANICDENITLAAGGMQKRYRTSGTASDSDDRMNVINSFLSCMNACMRDNNGKLSITIMKNDLADYVLDLDDNDILDEFQWNQTRGLADTYNIVRGRYIDPSDNSLYQLVDYPEIRIDSLDGIERVMNLDLAYVEDASRAQRIAKQMLQRNQYRGMFTATFTAKALGCQVGDVVRLSFETLGWSNKLFRVVSQQIDFSGRVPLALIEENAAIYAWDAEEQAAVTPTAPTVYNPLNSPFIIGITDAAGSANWSGVVDDNGNKPDDNATLGAPSGTSVAGRSADTVAATIKSTGIIDTDKVETASIISNSVTVPVSAYTSGAITSFGPFGASDTDIQTVTITSSGAPITIWASCAIQYFIGTMKIKRDGTTIATYTFPVSASSGGSFAANISDTPSAGSHTYTLVHNPNGTAQSISNRSLNAMETKR